MKQYMAGIVVFGYGPLLYGIIYYFSDVWSYLGDDPEADVQLWQVCRTSSLQSWSFMYFLYFKIIDISKSI